MMNRLLVISLLVITKLSFGQATQTIELNKEYTHVNLGKMQSLFFSIKLEKGGLYNFSVLQQGIDVKLILMDENGKQILDKDSPNGSYGYEKFEYSPVKNAVFQFKIERLDEKGNSEKGLLTILISKISKAEIQLRDKIKKDLEPENKKTVQTLDIDHFWEAFDGLKNCKTHNDSVNTFQTLYLNRATDGLLDFIVARDFTAEKFVNTVSAVPNFYNSVRPNTYEAKKSAPMVEEIVENLKQLYPNFKPKKVCFAIGIVNTGGTVSGNFLLIGTEVSCSNKSTDLSEFKNNEYSKMLANGDDVVQKLKNMIAHEYVHTQQVRLKNNEAISCELLNAIMKEGFCDFIGELISGVKMNL